MSELGILIEIAEKVNRLREAGTPFINLRNDSGLLGKLHAKILSVLEAFGYLSAATLGNTIYYEILKHIDIFELKERYLSEMVKKREHDKPKSYLDWEKAVRVKK